MLHERWSEPNFNDFGFKMLHSLKLTASFFPENRLLDPKKKQSVFQPSIFRCELLVSGSVPFFWEGGDQRMDMCCNLKGIWDP